MSNSKTSRISWTPDNDQLLFFLTLASSNIKIDANAIERAWPSHRTPKPTARAIQERFVKIRKLAVKMGAGDFSIGSSSNPGTPSKITSSAAGSAYKAGGGSKGRAVRPPVSFTTARPDTRMKRVKEESEDEDEDDGMYGGGGGAKKSPKKRKLSVKSQDDDDEDADGDGEGLSTTRSRRASSEKSKAPAYADDDDEEDGVGDGLGDAEMEDDSGDEYAEEV